MTGSLWMRFSCHELMWRPGDDVRESLERVFRDTVHVNYRVVDTDLLHAYVARFLEGLPPDPVIIDAGGGWGRVVIPLATEGFSVTVLDASPAYMTEGQAVARRFGVDGRVRFVATDLATDDLATESADLVLYVESIEYMPTMSEKEQVIRRVFELVRPGGLMVITAVDRLAMANFMFRRLLFWPHVPAMMEEGGFPDLRGNMFYPPDPQDFDRLLAATGGTVVDRRTYLHTDSILMQYAGFVPSVYYDNPELPRRLFELNKQLMDDPAYADRGFFHAACVRKR